MKQKNEIKTLSLTREEILKLKIVAALGATNSPEDATFFNSILAKLEDLSKQDKLQDVPLNEMKKYSNVWGNFRKKFIQMRLDEEQRRRFDYMKYKLEIESDEMAMGVGISLLEWVTENELWGEECIMCDKPPTDKNEH
jgi:hypothetical protein